MVKIIRILIIVLLSSTISVGLVAQDGIVSSGGNGTGSNGSFSFSFGQFAYENYLETIGSVAQGIQHPFEWYDLIKVVPETLTITDQTIAQGNLLCFNAQQTLTIAGEGHSVVVQNLGVADFIAGQSIRFLPGFTAQLGSAVHGSIAVNNSFCEGYVTQSIVEAPVVEKDIEISARTPLNTKLSPEMLVTLYPNPNHGYFKINLINFEDRATMCIYNVTGSVFFTSSLELSLQNEINLSYLRNGVYFVKVSCGKRDFVKKIIVNQ
jgi:hypothetical protein